MESVPNYTRKDLEVEAFRIFGAGSVTGILKILDRYDAEDAAGRARVQMACLKLCEGRIDLVTHFVEQARKDYRDVLYWAEYYDET